MRFSEKAYLKAFPREDRKPVKVEVGPGNVVEEAEKIPTKKIMKDPEPEQIGDVIEEAPEPEIQEGEK